MSAKTRLWILGTVVLCAALVLFGVVAGLLPQLSAAASTDSLAENTSDLNTVQEARLAQLQNAKTRADELKAELAELRKAIPDAAVSSAWVEELHRIESASGVRVTDFTVASLAEGQGAQQSAPPADGATDASAAPAEAGPQQIPITIAVEGKDRKSVADFVRRLQEGDRLVKVVALDVKGEGIGGDSSETGAEATGEKWTSQITGFLFALPES